MEPMLKELVSREIRTVLEAQRSDIRQLIRESFTPELHRVIREELDKELLLKGASFPLSGLEEPGGEAPLTVAMDLPTAFVPNEASLQEAQGAIEGNAMDLPTAFIPDEASPQEAQEAIEGKYVYGIVKKGEGLKLGPMGIEGDEVYIIWDDGMGAVVHDCLARPYESTDEETVKRWLLAHQNVIDEVWKRCDVIIPTTFDTIIAAEKGRTSEETVKEWLSDGRDGFMAKLETFKDKAEYGVQVFWNAPVMMQTLAQENETVQKMSAELQEKSKGSAYLHRQKLEMVMKKELENKADHYFREFYQGIKACAVEVKIEKTKKAEDPARQMIMNLTCLLPREESETLGQELERIHQMACFFVRFTGPWPPYSFV